MTDLTPGMAAAVILFLGIFLGFAAGWWARKHGEKREVQELREEVLPWTLAVEPITPERLADAIVDVGRGRRSGASARRLAQAIWDRLAIPVGDDYEPSKTAGIMEERAS